MNPILCMTCGATFAGSRSEARRAAWEPYSNRTQALLDAGPMVCPECVRVAIERCIAAAKAYWAAKS